MIAYYYILFCHISKHFKSVCDIIIKNEEVTKMKALKKQISITIDSDIIKQIRYYAEEDDRPLSQYINRVLKEHIKKREHKFK